MSNVTPGPLQPVPQPQLVRPRLSLLSGADIIDMAAAPDVDFGTETARERRAIAERFGAGFAYAPEGDVVLGQWLICDQDGDEDGGPDEEELDQSEFGFKTPNYPFKNVIGNIGGNTEYSPWVDGQGAVEFWPYAVYSSDSASTFTPLGIRNGLDRAKRKLNAALPYMLEAELWTGSMNQFSGRINPSIANAAVDLNTGGITPGCALGILEQALADAQVGGSTDTRGTQKGGMRYMIHMRPKVLLDLAANYGNNLIRRDGNIWVTPMDNIIVAGRGYPGSGPVAEDPILGPGTPGAPATATTEWIYATPVVEVRLGLAQNYSNDLRDIVRREQNQATFWYEQIVHAGFDPTLACYAAEVCVPDCICPIGP